MTVVRIVIGVFCDVRKMRQIVSILACAIYISYFMLTYRSLRMSLKSAEWRIILLNVLFWWIEITYLRLDINELNASVWYQNVNSTFHVLVNIVQYCITDARIRSRYSFAFFQFLNRFACGFGPTQLFHHSWAQILQWFDPILIPYKIWPTCNETKHEKLTFTSYLTAPETRASAVCRHCVLNPVGKPSSNSDGARISNFNSFIFARILSLVGGFGAWRFFRWFRRCSPVLLSLFIVPVAFLWLLSVVVLLPSAVNCAPMVGGTAPTE